MPAILLQKNVRLDHFTMSTTSQEAFDTITDRLVARGASDGTLTPFGESSLLASTDPDGHRMEDIFVPAT